MSINVTVVGSTNVQASVTGDATVGVSVGSAGSVGVAIGTMAAQTLTSLAIAGGANVTVTTSSGVFTIIGRDPPVTSVNGKTGVVTLVASEFGAASASHTHVAANVTNFAAEAAKYGPVSSVNGKTGTVTLVATDVTAASATHAHSYVQTLNGQTGTVTITAGANVTVTTSAGAITIAAAAATGSGNILSVNGRTGVVVLNSTDVSAASAVHTHVAANITDFAAEAAKYGPVSSVNGKTGTVTLVASDVSAASASHTHVVANITDFAAEAAKYGPVSSVNGKTGTVTLVTSGDCTAVSVGSKYLSASVNNYDSGTTDIVRVESTGGLSITGLAAGTSGVVKLLVNVGTNDVTLSTQDTNSASTNRFLIVGGDHVLREGDSATAWYDGISQRWRLVVHEPAAPPFLWGSVSATANLNNYAPGTATVLRITGNTTRLVTGFAGGDQNKMLRVVNVATNILTLVHNSTASDSSNRLLLDTGTNRSLDENDQAELLYDPISLRWRVTPCCGGAST